MHRLLRIYIVCTLSLFVSVTELSKSSFFFRLIKNFVSKVQRIFFYQPNYSGDFFAKKQSFTTFYLNLSHFISIYLILPHLTYSKKHTRYWHTYCSKNFEEVGLRLRHYISFNPLFNRFKIMVFRSLSLRLF